MIAGLFCVIASLGAAPLAQEAPSQPPQVAAFGGVAITIDHDLVAEFNVGDRRTVLLPIGLAEPLSLELEPIRGLYQGRESRRGEDRRWPHRRA